MNKNQIIAIVVVILVVVGGYFAYVNNMIPGMSPAPEVEMMEEAPLENMEGEEQLEDVQGEYTEEYTETVQQ